MLAVLPAAPSVLIWSVCAPVPNVCFVKEPESGALSQNSNRPTLGSLEKRMCEERVPRALDGVDETPLRHVVGAAYAEIAGGHERVETVRIGVVPVVSLQEELHRRARAVLVRRPGDEGAPRVAERRADGR